MSKRRENSFNHLDAWRMGFDHRRLPMLAIIKHTPDDQLDELAQRMGLSLDEYHDQVKHGTPRKPRKATHEKPPEN